MSPFIFFTVLLAAFLHAAWNVVVKRNADRLVSLTVLQGLMGVMGLGFIAWFGLPGEAAWPYALCSGLLHTGYNLFLVRAYRSADLAQIYPVARGTAPLLTLLASQAFGHDVLGLWTTLGIMVLVAGLLTTGWGGTKQLNGDSHAMRYALGTACFIAAYTLVDGAGARVSGNAFGYSGVLFVFDAVFLLIAGYMSRGRRFGHSLLPHWKVGILGALASGTAYALVIWAMTQAPIASVAALRETSIVFVLLLSARVLKESLTAQRIAGALLIVAGAVLLRMA